MSEKVVEVDSLLKLFGNLRAVDEVSFDLYEGEVFAFLGPNGAGKTTTVEILECIRPLTSGSARVFGYDVTKGEDAKEIKKRIGVLPQDFSALDKLSVKENIDLIGSMYEKMFQKKYGFEVSKIVRKLAAGFGGCSAGLTYAGLTASGDLLPCVPAPIKLGNLLEKSLEEIWIQNELLNRIRKREALKGLCRTCTYNSLCGGCRYTAFIANGDWPGTDTSCPFGPKIMNG